ncbi:GTP-binding protein [Halomonas sp. ML-15]|uniref:CobW family GTP-binding protein n=1 Tax=Halomonas sp. ML-15 TaxID=2773305 RepID=UPI001745E625|nr:GTP-binding protein [Halomonas sp. ML-15]MBD3894480.1 GTP-binding protein [Halomonas sp. ML-15]
MRDSDHSIGVHLVCGFLGSGKTTLINDMIASGEISDALFLINDFGSMNIDADLIDSREGGVIRLTNGCVCCGLSGNLSSQLTQIRRWPDPPRRLVVEASGVAQPRSLMQLFNSAPGYCLAQVELLVDLSLIGRLLEDSTVGELVRYQVAEVPVILINRWDVLDEGERDASVKQLEALNPDVTLSWSPSRESGMPTPRQASLGESVFPELGQLVPGVLATFTLTLPGTIDARRLAQLLDAAGEILLRAKGFILSEEAPDGCLLIQWTPSGSIVTQTFRRQAPTLVLIGKGRDNLAYLATLLLTYASAPSR